MIEYLTAEELRQRQGMDFFLGARVERILDLCDGLPRGSQDEVWVSAFEGGVQYVEGGRILGMRVVVTATVPAGEIRLWSDARKEFVS